MIAAKTQVIKSYSASELINKYADYCISNKDSSEHTIKNGAIQIKKLFFYIAESLNKSSFVLDNFDLQIKLEDVDTFVAQQTNMSQESIITMMGYIKGFYKYLKSRDFIEVDAMHDYECCKRKGMDGMKIKYLTIEEIQTLFNTVDTRNQIRDICIIGLCVNCGLRVAEVVNIKINDIQGTRLLVFGKGKKERYVHLNESTMEVLEEYLSCRPKVDFDNLFVSERLLPLSKISVQKMVKKVFVGMDKKDFSIHKLRHTFATSMATSGISIEKVSKMLGHGCTATTQVYFDIIDTDIKEAMENNLLNKINMKGKIKKDGI